MLIISIDLMYKNIIIRRMSNNHWSKTYLFSLGLWVGWPGLDLNEMKNETVPESDPEDTSPTAGLK